MELLTIRHDVAGGYNNFHGEYADLSATMEDVDLNRNMTSDQIVDLHVWAIATNACSYRDRPG